MEACLQDVVEFNGPYPASMTDAEIFATSQLAAIARTPLQEDAEQEQNGEDSPPPKRTRRAVQKIQI
jgi:hypothetical protein